MARGTWIKAVTPSVIAAGVEIDTDPFGLFTGEQTSNVAPYDPLPLQALQDSIDENR